MPRIRTIKPEMWQDEKLVRLPDVTRLIFIGLVSLADDAGRLLDKPVKIEADLFDGESDRREDVIESLATLARIGVIQRGLTGSGQRIIQITNWKRHQKVDHPNLAAAFPEIVAGLALTEIREPLANDSRAPREPFAHHTSTSTSTSTNDQRPVTPSACAPGANAACDQVPPLDLPFPELDEPDGTPPPTPAALTAPPVVVRKARAPRRTPSGTPKDPNSRWPHFPHEDRQFLIEQFSQRIKGDPTKADVAILLTVFGDRWYAKPEHERGPDRPTNAEIRAAVRTAFEAAEDAENGHVLDNPAILSRGIGRLVAELRTPRFDPVERMENVYRSFSLRPKRVAR
ncbi:hypothetical protein [Gemmatimonas sp.]